MATPKTPSTLIPDVPVAGAVRAASRTALPREEEPTSEPVATQEEILAAMRERSARRKQEAQAAEAPTEIVPVEEEPAVATQEEILAAMRERTARRKATPAAVSSPEADMSPAPSEEGAAVPPAARVLPEASETRKARGLAGARYAAFDQEPFREALRARVDVAKKRFQEQFPLASPEEVDKRVEEVSTKWRIAPESAQSQRAVEMYLDSKTSPTVKQAALEMLFPIPTDVMLSSESETWQSRARRIEEGGPSALLTKEEAKQSAIKKEEFDRMFRDTPEYTSTTDVIKDMINPGTWWNTTRALTASTGVREAAIKAGKKVGALGADEADLLLKATESAARNYELEDVERSLSVNDLEAAKTKFEALPFNKLPAVMDPKRPDVNVFREKYKDAEQRRLFGEQGLERLDTALFNNKSDEVVQDILNGIPQERLRIFQPDVGLPSNAVTSSVKAYNEARKELGLNKQADAIGGFISSMMYEPVTTEQGVLYQPSTIGHVMNLAGVTPELAYQAEVPIGAVLGVLMPGGMVTRAAVATGGAVGQKLISSVLDAAGANELAAQIDNALIPTKAGVDTMLSSRLYDGVAESLGIDPDNYQRVHSPNSTYLSRVRAATLVPEAQGFGAMQIREAAGLPENTFAGRVAFGLDLGTDLMFEPEHFIAQGLTVPRGATRAWKVSKMLPEGQRLQGAFAAAAPKTYSRVRAVRQAVETGETLRGALKAGGAAAAEADTLSALHTALRDGFIEDLKRGNDPMKGLSAARKQEVYRVVRDAGIKPGEAAGKLKELADALSLATIDAVDAGIRREAVTNRAQSMVSNLRKSKGYLARRAELDDAVKQGMMTKAESDAAMAALEAQAHRFAADSAKTGFSKPEDFFEQVEIVTRRAPPAAPPTPPTAAVPPTPPPAAVVPPTPPPAAVVPPTAAVPEAPVAAVPEVPTPPVAAIPEAPPVAAVPEVPVAEAPPVAAVPEVPVAEVPEAPAAPEVPVEAVPAAAVPEPPIEGRTPLTTERIENGLGSKPVRLRKAMEFVAENTADPFRKRLAERLLEVGGRFDKATFQIVQGGRGGMPVVTKATAGTRGGSPQSVLNQLKKNANGLTVSLFAFEDGADLSVPQVYIRGSALGRASDMEGTILHEALHAATSLRYKQALKVNIPELTAARRQIDTVRQAVLDYAKKAPAGSIPLDVRGRIDIIKSEKVGSEELITYGFTDPAFTEFLKTVPVPLKNTTVSAWTQFVDAVAKLVGISKGDTNALAVLIEATEQLVSVSEERLPTPRAGVTGDIVGLQQRGDVVGLRRAPLQQDGLPVDIYAKLRAAISRLPDEVTPGARTALDGIVEKTQGVYEGRVRLDQRADEVIAQRLLAESGVDISELEMRDLLNLDDKAGFDSITKQELLEELDYRGRRVVETSNPDGSSTVVFEGLSDQPDARITISKTVLDDGSNALVVDAAEFGPEATTRPIMAKVVSLAGSRGMDTVVFRRAGNAADAVAESGIAMAAKSVGVDDVLDGAPVRRFSLDQELYEAALPTEGVLMHSMAAASSPTRAIIDLVNNGSFAGFVREDAKLLRTLGGDLWTDSFLSNFDHNVVRPDGSSVPGRVGRMPETGRVELTDLGQRQFEASLHTYLTRPRREVGPLRAAFDKFYTLMQVVYLKARGVTGDPSFIQMQLDALLRPDDLLRNRMVKVLDTPVYGMRTIKVSDTEAGRMAESVARAVGKSEETYRTTRGMEDLRQVLNIKKGDKTINLVDVMSEAYAHVLLTEARRSMDTLGRGQRLVRVGTRSAVPEERVPVIQKRLANRMDALRINVRNFKLDPTDGNYLLVDAGSKPGLLALIREVQSSWYGDFLPPEVTRANFTGDRIHVDAYDRVKELHKDLLAGPGALRDRIAENVPNSLGYALQKVFSNALDKNTFTSNLKKSLNETFVINAIGADVADPGVVEIFDYARRSLGDVDKWVRKTAEEIASKNPQALPGLVTQLADKLIAPLPLGPRVAPQELPLNLQNLEKANTLFVQGPVSVDQAVQQAASLDDMLDALDDTENLFLDFKPLGVSSMTDLERRAFAEARRIKDQLVGGTPLEELNDLDRNVLQDALNIIADGVERRNGVVDDVATSIIQAMAGGESNVILAAFDNPKVRLEVYARFYEGNWAGLFDFNTYVGLSVSFEDFGEFQTKYSQSQAVLAMVGRLKAQQILTELSEKLALYGVRSDMEWLTRNYGEIGSIKNRRDFVGNVASYIQAELGGNNKVLIVKGTAGKINKDVVKAPKGAEELAAYVQANETINRYGYKRGSSSDFEKLLLPDGTQILVPSVFAEEYKAALTRHTSLTGGFTEAASLTGRAPEAENIVAIEPTARQKAAMAKAAKERDVRTVTGGAIGLVAGSMVGMPVLGTAAGALAARNLSKVLEVALGGFDMTLRYAKVGLTTGIGLPNPAYYVANFVGGFFQAAAAIGTANTVRAIFSEPRLVADVVSQMTDSNFVYGSGKMLITKDGRVYTTAQLRRVAEAEGLSGGFVQAETVRAVADDLRRMEPTAVNKVLRPFRGWQQALVDAATAIDNYYRVSLFIDELKAGKNATEAAATARKAAFDYTALTDREKGVMRRAVLFYSFLRRNVDLFYDTAMTNPGRILAQLRMANYSRRALLKENAEIVEPDYLEGRVYLYVRQALKDQPDAGRLAVLLPELPAMDVMQLFASAINYATDEKARQEVLSRFAPLVQGLAVGAFGMEPFSGRQLGTYDKIPWWLYHMDMNISGGVLVNAVFGAKPKLVNDPLTADRTDTGTYMQATNPLLWWAWRNFMQFPGAGRSMSTIDSIDYADLGAIETVVGLTEDYRRSGGNEVLDDALKTIGEMIAPEAVGLAPLIEAPMQPTSYAELVPPREGFTKANEQFNILGIRSTRIPSEGVGVSRFYREAEQKLREETKGLEKFTPYRK